MIARALRLLRSLACRQASSDKREGIASLRFAILAMTEGSLSLGVLFAMTLFLIFVNIHGGATKGCSEPLKPEAVFEKTELSATDFPIENMVIVEPSMVPELLAPLSEPSEVTFIAVGDIMLSRDVARKMKKYDIHYPFSEVADFLKSGDIVFGNLESPITEGREIHSYEMVFRADPGVETALKDAGFTILSLANNHSPNFGADGLRDTFQYLRNADIQYVGAGEDATLAYSPVFVEKNGLKFAFFAYNDTDVVPDGYEAVENRPGTAFMNTEVMKKAVSEVDSEVDFVIVSMHSGKEYTAEPNVSQTEFAHVAVDAGADLVIGHHPHVVQTAEKYQGKYIFYSLGNFVFDQMWSNETRLGLAVKFVFRADGISDISFLPVLIEDYAKPKALSGDAARTVLKRLELREFEERL